MKDWEKRFNEDFTGELWLGRPDEDDTDRLQLIDFIKKTLLQQRKEIVEEIMKIGFFDSEMPIEWKKFGKEWKAFTKGWNLLKRKILSKEE